MYQIFNLQYFNRYAIITLVYMLLHLMFKSFSDIITLYSCEDCGFIYKASWAWMISIFFIVITFLRIWYNGENYDDEFTVSVSTLYLDTTVF